MIGSLVAKSMVTTDEAADGTTRYRLLETLRQYARERLDDLGDPDVWRRRHAEHYAEFAEQAGAELVGPEELAWRPRLIRELDNLRAAVGWSLDAESPDDREPAIRVVVGLTNEANSGTASEVGSWAERELPLVDGLSAEQRAAVLNAAAWNALARRRPRRRGRARRSRPARTGPGFRRCDRPRTARIRGVDAGRLRDGDRHPRPRDWPSPTPTRTPRTPSSHGRPSSSASRA